MRSRVETITFKKLLESTLQTITFIMSKKLLNEQFPHEI
jgi:hypothetical protein